MHQDYRVFYISDGGADIVDNVLAGCQVAPIPRAHIPVKMGKAAPPHFLNNAVDYIGGAVVAPAGEPVQAGGIARLFVDPVIYLFIIFQKSILGAVNLAVIMAVGVEGEGVPPFHNI